MLHELFTTILERKRNMPPTSYTASLLKEGREAIQRKVGEEALEVILASSGEGTQRLVEESADLIYHLLVLLAYHDLGLLDVEAELRRRHAPPQAEARA